ncbi:MAG: efflux RND transporter periplasmic adaptor subunit [Bacteroidales bacterium]
MKKINILFLMMLVLASCTSESGKADAEAETVKVSTFNAEKRYHQEVFEYSGSIKPFREANLGSTIPGKVEKIHFDPGEYVNKGALVVELSAEPMLMAQAEMDAVEKDYLRVKRLHEKGSVTQQDFDHVTAKYEASKSKLELFKSNSRILAPFSGIIAEHLVNEGENFMFSPGLEIGLSHTSGIVRLLQVNPLRVSFNVNEKDIRHLKKGMQAEIVIDAYPEKHFSAKINKIGPVVSSMSRTAEVQLELPNPGGEIMPGMFAKVKIELPGDTLIFVPRHSVKEFEGQHFIWSVKNGIADKKNVKPILTKNGYTALENINEGEKVVVAGINKLSPGIAVEE